MQKYYFLKKYKILIKEKYMLDVLLKLASGFVEYAQGDLSGYDLITVELVIAFSLQKRPRE